MGTARPQEAGDDDLVPGLLLFSARTALAGRFPLNGTYFQVSDWGWGRAWHA
jgi:hypothetical protein